MLAWVLWMTDRTVAPKSEGIDAWFAPRLREGIASFAGGILERLERLAQSPRAKPVLLATRIVIFATVAGYLAYKLHDVNWEQFTSSLPRDPVFFLLFVLLYIRAPLFDLLCYRVIWTFNLWSAFLAFVVKRVFNSDILGFSGEVYFFTWAKKNVPLRGLELAKGIRDQTILSSVAALMMTFGLVGAAAFVVDLNIDEWFKQQSVWYLAAVFAASSVVGLIALCFRSYLFSMSPGVATSVLSLHFCRLLIGKALTIAMWSVAMPDVALHVWVMYAALAMVVSRIPLIPNRDIIFLGLSVSVSTHLGVSEVAFFAILLSMTIMDKVTNAVFFSIAFLLQRKVRNREANLKTPPDLLHSPS